MRIISFLWCMSDSASAIPSLLYLLCFSCAIRTPYASHILSCDVISCTFTPTGSLLTTCLILKTATLQRWVPKRTMQVHETQTFVLICTILIRIRLYCRCESLPHSQGARQSCTRPQLDPPKTTSDSARVSLGPPWLNPTMALAAQCLLVQCQQHDL